MPGARRPAPSRHRYIAISTDLERTIRAREIERGHNLPSERQLAEHYGTTRQTIRAAIDRLHAAGLVARDVLGTYVSSESSVPAGAVGARGAPRAPSEHFPGLLLHTEVLHCTGVLTDAKSDIEGQNDDADDGHTPFLYRHWAFAHDGRIVQSSISSFHHQFVSKAPPLAKAVRQAREEAAAARTAGPPGVEPDLGKLLGWLAGEFPDAQRVDHVRALSHPASHPLRIPYEPQDPSLATHVHVERTFRGADGLVLLRTVFHIFDDQAQLTYRPENPAAYSPNTPESATPAMTGATAVQISDRDRAWLEAWLLPGSPDRALANRARIILNCTAGSAQQAAARSDVSVALVHAWLGRYSAGGIDALRQPIRRGNAGPDHA